MGVRHADRLWMIAGAIVVVALVAISWLFVISTKFDETRGVREQVEITETQIVKLRSEIAKLQKEQAKLPEFRAALKVNQNALPSDSGLPDFLRQLQSSGDALNVQVGGISVSGATTVDGVPNVWALPITLNAEGSPANLGKFLDQLQQTQPRAVLINSATMTAQAEADAADGAGTGDVAISLALSAFVAPPAGVGAPSITTE